jgi:purine-binding chemotaxis protein CheW
MQQNSSYLIFSLNNKLYGIKSNYFEEVLPLPELILLPEVDCGIVGSFDLRGETLPVLDLNNKLGYPQLGYRLSDSLIVVRCSQLRIGIIIHGFPDIRTISLQEIVKSSNNQLNDDLKPLIVDQSEIIIGAALGEDKVWILNDLENWIMASQIRTILDGLICQKEEIRNSNLLLNQSILGEEKQNIFCLTATNEEKAIFRNRAESLKASSQPQEPIESQPLVVFTLGTRLWGIDSGNVREFIDIKKLTPVPCCPIHIIGNTNLRGEILTLVDIRKPLNLPITEIPIPCKAIVVELEDMVVGIMVDSIRDAMFLMNSQDIVSATTALPDVEKNYLQGAIAYEENNQQLIGILDLSKLLVKGGLVIDELV